MVLSCAVFGCSLALTLSVWGRKTHEVLMATYVFGILYLLAAPILAGIQAMLPAAWWASWLPSFMDLLPIQPDLPGAGERSEGRRRAWRR